MAIAVKWNDDKYKMKIWEYWQENYAFSIIICDFLLCFYFMEWYKSLWFCLWWHFIVLFELIKIYWKTASSVHWLFFVSKWFVKFLVYVWIWFGTKTIHKNNNLQTVIKREINNFKLYMKPVYSFHYANLSNRKNILWYNLADFVVFRLVWVLLNMKWTTIYFEFWTSKLKSFTKVH